MPIQIGTARAWARLRDAFDLKGKHNLQLDEIVVPVVVVEDLSLQAPLADLRPAEAGFLDPSAIGFISQTQLFNPVGSGRMIFLYQIIVTSQNDSGCLIGPATTTMPLVANGNWQDRRLDGVPAGDIQSQTNAPGTSLIDAITWLVEFNVPVILELEVVLPPGNAYRVESTVQNNLVTTGFWWRERDLLPGE